MFCSKHIKFLLILFFLQILTDFCDQIQFHMQQKEQMLKWFTLKTCSNGCGFYSLHKMITNHLWTLQASCARWRFLDTNWKTDHFNNLFLWMYIPLQSKMFWTKINVMIEDIVILMS